MKLWYIEVRNEQGNEESHDLFEGTEENAVSEGIAWAKEANSLGNGEKTVVVTEATRVDDNFRGYDILDYTAYQGTGKE